MYFANPFTNFLCKSSQISSCITKYSLIQQLQSEGNIFTGHRVWFFFFFFCHRRGSGDLTFGRSLGPANSKWAQKFVLRPNFHFYFPFHRLELCTLPFWLAACIFFCWLTKNIYVYIFVTTTDIVAQMPDPNPFMALGCGLMSW